MSRAANPAVVGGFVVGAIVLILASALLFGTGRFFQERLPAVAYFSGNVRGLQEGSPVEFRGVRVGTVRAIRLVYDPREAEMRIPVLLELEPGRLSVLDVGSSAAGASTNGERFLETLVEQGLRAQLEIRSLVTGQLTVSLDMHPGTPVRRVGGMPDRYEMPTLPSTLDRVSRVVQELPLQEMVAKLMSTLDHVERLFASPQLAEGVGHAGEAMAAATSLLRALESGVPPLLSDLQAALEDTRVGLRDAEREAAETLTAYRELARRSEVAIEGLAGNLDRTLEDLGRFARGADTQMVEIGRASIVALDEARRALAQVGGLAAEDSHTRYNLDRALEELAGAARALRLMAEYLEQNPDALLRGRGR